eukprot:scaffold6_cov190-Alexandrium_tamarense.AAC.20
MQSEVLSWWRVVDEGFGLAWGLGAEVTDTLCYLLTLLLFTNTQERSAWKPFYLRSSEGRCGWSRCRRDAESVWD